MVCRNAVFRHAEQDVVVGVGGIIADASCVVAEHIVVLPSRRSGGENIDAAQVRQVDERARANGGDGGGQPNLEKCLAAFEGEVADAGHILGQRHFRHFVAHTKGHCRDLGNGIGGAIHRDGGGDLHLADGILRNAGVVARAEVGFVAYEDILGRNACPVERHGALHDAIVYHRRVVPVIQGVCTSKDVVFHVNGILQGLVHRSIGQLPDGRKLGSAHVKLSSRTHMVILERAAGVQFNHPLSEGIAGALTVVLRHHVVVITMVEEHRMLWSPALGEVVARQGELQVLHQATLGRQRNACRRSVGAGVGSIKGLEKSQSSWVDDIA